MYEKRINKEKRRARVIVRQIDSSSVRIVNGTYMDEVFTAYIIVESLTLQIPCDSFHSELFKNT